MSDPQDTTPSLAEQYADIFFQLFRYGLSYPPSMSPRMAEHYGRQMGRYGRIVQAARDAARQECNRRHREEVERAFATLHGFAALQQAADDKALTDYLASRDAHLGAVER